MIDAVRAQFNDRGGMQVFGRLQISGRLGVFEYGLDSMTVVSHWCAHNKKHPPGG